MSFQRILAYKLPKASTPLITAACSSDLLSIHEQIEGLRSAAAGFSGEEKSVSEDGLTVTFVSTWDSKASYDAFYTANKSLIDQWDQFKLPYAAQYDVGITESYTGN